MKRLDELDLSWKGHRLVPKLIKTIRDQHKALITASADTMCEGDCEVQCHYNGPDFIYCEAHKEISDAIRQVEKAWGARSNNSQASKEADDLLERNKKLKAELAEGQEHE